MVMERPNRYATDTPWAAVCCSVSAALPLAGSVVWPLAQECMELAPKDGFTPPCHLEAAKSVPRTCSVPSFPSLLRVFPGFPLMLAESPLPLSFLFTLAVFLQRISCCTHCIIGALSLRLMYQKQQGINNRSTVKNVGERAVSAAPLRISACRQPEKPGLSALFSAMPLALCCIIWRTRSTITAAASTGGVPSRWMLEMTERSDSSVAAVGRYTP